jgi:hypothetical protein
MKNTVLASLVVLSVGSTCTSAFMVPLPPTMFGASVLSVTRTTHALFSEPAKETTEGELDLDLEEMFTMFDSAAKGEDFDDAIKKVKKD